MNEENQVFSVLVVDDKKLIRDIVCEMIRKVKPDADISTAVDGAKAVRKMTFESEPFKLVFADVEMPGIFNGFDVLSQSKVLNEDFGQDIKVIIMSSNDLYENQAKVDGAIGFMKKPPRLEEIMTLIQKCLNEK